MSEHENERTPDQALPPRVETRGSVDRRSFLAGVTGAAAVGAGSAFMSGLVAPKSATALPLPTDSERANAAFQVRLQCATDLLNAPLESHPVNGDEALYSDRIGSYSKGLPHNAFGEVDTAAYQTMLNALDAGTQAAVEGVPSGCPTIIGRMRFTNPLGGLAYDLEGVDGHNTTVRAAPTFASAETAGEMAELYWMALLRDVPFTRYRSHPLAVQACADLSALSDFRGPRLGGAVAPMTLFRDQAPGCTVGPYLSQFWYRSQPFGSQYVEPRMRTVAPGVNYCRTVPEFAQMQNGIRSSDLQVFDNSTLRWMRNGRDLGQWVHIDVLHQAYFQAALAMIVPQEPGNPFTGGGMNVPLNPGNPYAFSQKQFGFTTFGPPHIMTLLTEVSTRALKATWYQKWYVHRRIRPEAFAGRVHHKLHSGRNYPVHSDVLNSAALPLIASLNLGNKFLPLAYPEGCPTHPAYTAGHATVAGACVTLLKALFNENQALVNPVVPTDDGLSLVPYTGPDAGQMTIGGELNKLAANVAYGRHIAGVHWRSDGYESLRLGEAVAISLMRDQRRTFFEDFHGFTFTKFDGTSITV